MTYDGVCRAAPGFAGSAKYSGAGSFILFYDSKIRISVKGIDYNLNSLNMGFT